MSEDLLRELSPEGVLTLTLNRPQTLNSLGGTMVPDLIAALTKANDDRSVRAILITGAGRGFCSGADMSTGGPNRVRADGQIAGESLEDRIGTTGRLVMAMAESRAPIVGAINGPAVGAGLGIALCCDVRIASEQARMGTIFIKRGLATDYGVGYWLPRLVGPAKAFELLYSGDILSAPELLELGLVNKVVPHEALMEEAMAYARTIADGPLKAYGYTRRVVIESLRGELERFLEQEWNFQSELLASEDAREGFRAFAEKRAPRFAR
jgi:2-(1,2-epoxy-1,2-dihydrophenyl)acetyl-CoA isomerase